MAARPIVVAPYASPYYDPFFWGFYGWGYPGWYGPGWWGPPAYSGYIVDTSSARVQVTPRETEVYVDGYLAGVADDFDGVTQRLRVEPGEHVIELYLDGHKPISQTIRFAPGQSYRIRHEMEPLAAGEPSPARPAPKPGASSQRPAFDAFGNPTRAARVEPAAATSGGSSITIRVQPGDAVILIDGERWQSSGGERLEIQVSPGEHRVEVQKDGYQPFTTTIRVGPGDASSLNVSLTKTGGEQ